MGYATTAPFIIGECVKSGTVSLTHTVGNAAADYALGTIITPPYTHPITRAYAALVITGCVDTSGALNYFRYFPVFAETYINLWDGTSNQSCGHITYESWFPTPANGVSGFNRIPSTTNIAAYLKPNTTYTATMKNWSANADSLVVYGSQVELTLFGNL